MKDGGFGSELHERMGSRIPAMTLKTDFIGINALRSHLDATSSDQVRCFSVRPLDTASITNVHNPPLDIACSCRKSCSLKNTPTVATNAGKLQANLL